MDHLTFDKGFWKSFIWFLVIALLICCLPWLLAKHSWIDFSTTGEIGDTIGGIMGPFIAIAAAGLTFIAFWVQYKANIQQRHDIAIERFEKFYKNLTDEERQEQRALDVIPILNDMYQDLLYYANTATAKCGELLMKAINYAKAEWKA